MRFRRKSWWLAGATALLALAVVAGNSYLRAAAFIVRAAGMEGIARSAARLEFNAVDERSLTVPWRGGQLKARSYSPRGGSTRAMLLTPGVHASGIDEPRFVLFARDLAAVRHTVLTVELPDLADYRITARTTDMIEDAAGWLAADRTLTADGRVGLMGISFAGGLSVVAASRPSLQDRVAFVMSFGGHGDLPRTLTYLCTGILPDGSHLPPHDYGVVIILLSVTDRLVPAEQVAPLQAGIRLFLEASRLDLIDKARSKDLFERARAVPPTLPEPARTLMTYVNDRDVAHLGPLLLPHTAAFAGGAALSPARVERLGAPVFLLHGTGDNVIPAMESVLLANTLDAKGIVVHQLATPLITHAEVDKSVGLPDMLRLVSFWQDLLER